MTVCSHCGVDHEAEEERYRRELVVVAQDTTRRINAHTEAFASILERLSDLPDIDDKLAVAAGIVHFLMSANGEETEAKFDKMLDSLLFVLDPDNTTVAALSRSRHKA